MCELSSLHCVFDLPHRIMIKLKEVIGKDIKPPYQRWDNPDMEFEIALKSPFTAFDYALRNGPSRKLWLAVKGSPYEPQYVRKFGQQPQ